MVVKSVYLKGMKVKFSLSSHVPQVYESDAAGHGHEDGEPRGKPRHETWYAAWHGRTGSSQKPSLLFLNFCDDVICHL